jgi:hypothetical protein
MRSLVLLSAAALIVSATGANAGSPSVTGSWTGDMRQVDVSSESHYPMTLTLNGKTGTSSYPQLNCAGTLTKVGQTESGYVLYQETIKNEPGATCIDGLVMVTVDGGKLILGWYAAYQGSPSLASAVLSPAAKN